MDWRKVVMFWFQMIYNRRLSTLTNLIAKFNRLYTSNGMYTLIKFIHHNKSKSEIIEN
jgi:hypothetical protein